MTNNFKYGNISETGSAGTVNEDYYGCFDTANGKVFVICDGMSNPIGGHIASKTAVEAIREFYNLAGYNNLIVSLHNAIEHANNAVLRKIQAEPELVGMNTTCLIVIIKDYKVYYAEIGESRLYHFSKSKCRLLSGKQTLSQTADGVSAESLRLNEVNPPETSDTNALGISTKVDPHICSEPLNPSGGDLLLLCSAGLPDILVESFCLPIINNKDQDVQMRVADLVKLADKNHTADNTTLQLIEFNMDPHQLLNEPIAVNPTETVVIKQRVEQSGKSPVILPIILVLMIAAVIYFGFYNYKQEDTAVTASTEIKSDTIAAKKKVKLAEASKTSGEDGADLPSASGDFKNHVPKNPVQLPPVNSGFYAENNSGENTEAPVRTFVRSKGTGEAYVYTIQPGDDATQLKKTFRKPWEQLKGEDPDYTDAVPSPGKELKIYGYIFFASGSDRERNENIENALKSSPGLKRSDIITVPDGILIP